MTTVLGILIAALAVGLVVWQRSSRRDETFAGITPGLLPAPGQPEQRFRIGRGQAAPVAVRFEPPAGVRPALAGLIAESRLEPVAISATLVDLAVRGWLRMHPIEAEGDQKQRPRDWVLTAASVPPSEPLSWAERELLAEIFTGSSVATLQDVRRRGGLAGVLDGVAQEAAERKWFLPPPAISLAAAGAGAAVLGVVVLVVGPSIAPIGLGLLAAGAIAFLGGRGLPQPVSAEGYAARVQALGFKQYLATAEAEQLRFEVGIEQFSRYLPYAMVFGVVDHWRHVFADALQAELDAGGDFSGFGWLAVNDMLTTMVMVDLLTDGGLFDGLGDGFDGFGDGFGGDAGGFDSGAGGDGGFGGFDGGGFDGGGFDGGGFGGE